MQRRFDRALLIGCPDPAWVERLGERAGEVDVRDPGPVFASKVAGEPLIEEKWHPPEREYDLIVAVGTLDTVNDLPLALRLLRYAMRNDGLFIGALSGGDTLPQLRNAMRAADALEGGAAPHVHPRIEASALAPLLSDAGFINPVVDVDKVAVSYQSLDRLIADLRAMGATNVLTARPRFIGKAARAAAFTAFSERADRERTVEAFEILHFVGWTANKG